MYRFDGLVMHRAPSILLWIFALLCVPDAVEYSMDCILSVMNSREFDHYVKHATLATWTKEEVDKVLKGGNKVGSGGTCEL